jgi:hypothetical protein
LPPISPLEREDDINILYTVYSVRNNLRYDARVFEPPADGLEDWQIMTRLITEMVPMPARRFTTRVFNGLLRQLSPMRMTRLGWPPVPTECCGAAARD